MSLSKTVLYSLIFCLSLGVCSRAQALEVDEETRSVGNLIVSNVFSEIDARKKQYDDLKLFSRLAMQPNKYGFNQIEYYYKNPLNPKSLSYLQIFIGILPMDATDPYQGKDGYVAEAFPLLGLKVVAYQNPSLKHNQIDIHPLVQEQLSLFSDRQSKFLPLQLLLIPEKNTFQRGEPIQFTAILKNSSSFNKFVKDLSSKSISFQYDNVQWGADPDKGAAAAKTVPLRPGSSISKIFTISGLKETRELDIHATYLVEVDGVLPTASLHVKIAP